MHRGIDPKPQEIGRIAIAEPPLGGPQALAVPVLDLHIAVKQPRFSPPQLGALEPLHDDPRMTTAHMHARASEHYAVVHRNVRTCMDESVTSRPVPDGMAGT